MSLNTSLNEAKRALVSAIVEAGGGEQTAKLYADTISNDAIDALMSKSSVILARNTHNR